MRRIATALAAVALLLMAASPAGAAPPPPSTETVSVTNGVLTVVTSAAQVDSVSIVDGTPGQHMVTESQSPSGSVGAGCVAYDADTAACTGATSASISTLDLDDAVVIVSALPSTVDAGAGNDSVWGGPAADVLNGAAGIDDVRGGDGNDTIEARDGQADTIDCGAGDDRAYADAVDTVVNCETDPVPPTGGETPTDTTTPTTPTAPVQEPDAPKEPKLPAADAPRAILNPLPPVSPVALVASAVHIDRAEGAVPLELGCAETEVAGCRGDVFLDPAPQGKAFGLSKSKGGKQKKIKARMARRGRFGRSPFVIAAGQKAKVKIKLSAEARRALGLAAPKRAKKASKGGAKVKARAARRGRRVKAKVTVVQKGPKGRKASVAIIELRG